MRNSIAAYKETLSRLANGIDEELEISNDREPSGDDGPSPTPARRNSRRFSNPRRGSRVANGSDSESDDEGTADQSPTRRINYINQVNAHSNGSNTLNGNVRKQNKPSNRGIQTTQFDSTQQNMDPQLVNLNEKEHSKLFEEKYRSLAAKHSNFESEIKELRMLLENERENATMIELKLQEERKLNESFQRELHDLKMDKEKTSAEMKELQKELNAKLSELRQLQVDLNRRNEVNGTRESLLSLRKVMKAFEQENVKLKIEKEELVRNLELCMKNTREKNGVDESDSIDKKSNESSKVTEEMTLSIQKLEENLKNTSKQRDKALKDLERLKQHLLMKEMEESDKMDEDNRIIEELRGISEQQRARIYQLERALKQELARNEEIKNLQSEELENANKIINELRQEIEMYMTHIDAKNVELLNLQTALGQYYAECEAKERIGRELAKAREEAAKLSESLQASNQGLEASKREKEELTIRLSQAERILSDSKFSIQKLEEDNSKMRRALEQSMTTLNRMSLDSDNYVDRRIVIKLLVTYFQRNHSKEVLDLMVRMLGFLEEDKQRIGFAQHGVGKGVVRGVLGLPGRLVGGILGGSSTEVSSSIQSDKQSFADLWVDFLLKETEERERREASEAAGVSSTNADRSTSSTRSPPVAERATYAQSPASSFPPVHLPANQTARPLPSKPNPPYDNSDAEFSTVPLASSVSPLSEKSSYSRLPPR